MDDGRVSIIYYFKVILLYLVCLGQALGDKDTNERILLQKLEYLFGYS